MVKSMVHLLLLMLLLFFAACEYEDAEKDDKCSDECMDMYYLINARCARNPATCSLEDLAFWNLVCSECSDKVM
jgi:hypothetical protein